jgi:hypothetical protein
MIEETRMKKFIQNGVIKYARVEVTAEDLLKEKDLEITRLKNLLDELRNKIETLEQEEQRHNLIEAVDSADSYNIYK